MTWRSGSVLEGLQAAWRDSFDAGWYGCQMSSNLGFSRDWFDCQKLSSSSFAYLSAEALLLWGYITVSTLS